MSAISLTKVRRGICLNLVVFHNKHCNSAFNLVFAIYWSRMDNEHSFQVNWIEGINYRMRCIRYFLAAAKQLSVHSSVCDTFFTMFLPSYHHKIFGTHYRWQKWCSCKRLRSEVKGQGPRGQSKFYPYLLEFEFTNGFEMMHKAWSSIEEVSYCF